METRNRLTATRGELREGYGWKEVEVTSQGTCMNDPWTWTTGWGLTVGVGGGLGGDQRDKNWDNCNRTTKYLI